MIEQKKVEQMGSILNEYISKHWGAIEFKEELKRLVEQYNKLTKGNLFIYAADFNKGRRGIEVSLRQDDFYTIQDILRESPHEKIDFYIETPGGSGEAAEEIARFLHKKFKEVNFVVAGEAKSAGTILVLSGDNISMSETGSLGPIDAQVSIGRSVVSAYDYKTWVDDKRAEAAKTGKLNPFDAIMIAQISPGEVYGVVNSLDFAKILVQDWLVKYKFKNWTISETRQMPVTAQMKEKRAEDIANYLCKHTDWKTHGRSLKIEDLQDLLKIERIDDNPKLADIVYRIKTVIRLIFDTSTDYKLYFCEDCQIARTASVAGTNLHPPVPTPNNQIQQVIAGINCPKCGKRHDIPGYFNISSKTIKKLKLPVNPLIQENDVLVCDGIGCGFSINLKPLKNQIEIQSNKKISFC